MNWIAERLAALRIGQPAEHRNLAVFPLMGVRAGLLEYLTLDEALATGLIRIAEEGQAGRVPEVAVENEAAVPVLLIEGEELVGCRQNRVINVSILVPPKSKLVVPVSCVEQGRWYSTSTAFKSSGNAQFSKGRASKVASVTASLAEGSGYRSDQGAVWARIHEKAEALEVATATMAMSEVYDQVSPLLAEFDQCLPKSDEAIGAVFCIRQSVVGMDIFDHPANWKKYAPKLLRGYAMDALDTPQHSTDAQRWSPREFIDRTRAEKFDVRPSVGLGKDLRADLRDITAAALVVDDTVVHLCAFPRGKDSVKTQSIRSRILRRRCGFARTQETE